MENSDHDTAILQFQEICGTQDEEVCRMYLERFNWNLELAVQDYLNVGDGFGSFASDASVSNENLNNFEHNALRYRGPSAVGNRPDLPSLLEAHGPRYMIRSDARRLGWMEWGMSLISFPFRFVQRTLWDIARFLYRLIFPALHAVTDPVGDVNNFIQTFERTYGANHPRFVHGSYSMALNEAKRELKTLLVYLHKDSHHDADRFCRETLCSPLVQMFVDANCLLWACNVNSGEGYRVSNAMREYNYPFYAMICLRDNRMMLVFRREGFCSAEELLDILTAVVQDNENNLIALREERQQQQMDQLLRQQQEEAFQASLRADRERDLARRDEERKRNEVAEALRRQEEEGRIKEKERQQLRDQLRANLPCEPSQSDETIRVSLKFPSGFRVERRFLPTDSLQVLYKFAFCQDECPRQFSVVTNFPRTILFTSGEVTKASFDGPNGDTKTFAEASMGRAIMLLVLDNEA